MGYSKILLAASIFLLSLNVGNALAGPTSTILAPADGASIKGGCTITGTATDGAGPAVRTVEVSTDGGTTWNMAIGTGSWSYNWAASADGGYNIKSRAADDAGQVEAPGAGVTVKVDNAGPL